MRKIKRKKTIWVDFYDTICFRTVPETQILTQWANVMCRKYSKHKLEAPVLIACRNRIANQLQKDYNEVPYKETIGSLYKELNLENVSFDEFYSYSLEADIAVELGCQFRNEKVVKLLQKAHEDGISAYVVTDSYLPKSAFEVFIRNLGIKNLIDGIYVSEAVNRTKRKGDLYKYVLEDLNLNEKEVIMIGDNLHTDIEKARANGIDTIRLFPFWHKVSTSIAKIIKTDYSKYIVQRQFKDLYKTNNYAEYVILLYYHIAKLYQAATEEKAECLNFLSRGGYFQKILFDTYQYLLCHDTESIPTEYVYNSRRICEAAKQLFKDTGGAENWLKEYFAPYVRNNRLFLVDEGWVNLTQQEISEFAGYDTYGFYIGSKKKDPLPFSAKCIRRGLVFDRDENYKETKFYGIFSSNWTFYEQMLTADHGSAYSYYRDENGTLQYTLKENDAETYIYKKYIGDMQDIMLLRFKGLCAWLMGDGIDDGLVARYMMRTLLIATPERCAFMNDLDTHMYDNRTDMSYKIQFERLRLRPRRLLILPDDYVNTFSSIQRRVYNKPILNLLYYSVAYCFYWYVRLVKWI